MTAKNIYQRINAVMIEVEYAQKDTSVNGGGMNYKGVSHDQVLATIRPSMVKHGIVVEPHLIADNWTEPRKGREKSTNWIYEAFYAVHFVNIDEPKDRAIVEVTGHAGDSGDKAPGKAVSYSVKMAMLKLFGIETGENEESRNFEKALYTPQQKEEFDDLLENKNAMGMYCFTQFVGAEVYTELYNSFPTGKKVSGKRECDELTKGGLDSLKTTITEIKDMCDTSDPAVCEITSELSDLEKRFVVKALDESHITFIKSNS